MRNSLSFEDLCQTGRENLRAGRIPEAVAAFEEARQINDLDPDVHEGLATAHFMQHAYEPAVMHFERVTRLDPRRGASWINLGAVYNRMGNYQKAAEVLRRAVQIEKKSAIGYYNLGIAYKHLKQWNLAVPAYREAIRLEPRMADAYLNLANVYSELHNYLQAITHYKKALDLNPQLERAKRGLEKAEARLDARRQELSPFGRLVDPKQATAGEDATVPQSAAVAAAGRDLSEKEREHDRRALHELLKQMHGELQEVLAALEEELDPAVRTLNKMLTQPISPHGVSITKSEALDGFILARAKYLPRLTKLQKILRQLRDHEASYK
jgi:tetratricopeptide (TPR) repeat protein